MNTDRIFGKIFLPNGSNEEFEAWLTLSDSQIILEASIKSLRHEHWPLILGKFNGIDKITFVNCYRAGGIDVGAGGSYRKIKVSYCIKGLHANTPTELQFNRVALTAPALSEWIQEKEWIEEIKNNLYKIPGFETVADVKLSKLTLTINNSYSIRHNLRELKVKKVSTVSLQSEGLMDINEFAHVWRHFKKLILFLTNKNPEFDRIYLYQDKEEYEMLNVKDEIRDDRFSQGIDIRYNQVNTSISTIIENWFGHDKLPAIIDLILEKNINTQMSAQGFFLNVCVALETFYDNFLKIDKEGIKSRLSNRKIIAESIADEPLRAWFERESAYWKNPILRERLLGYRTIIESIIGTVFLNRFDVDSFISGVVSTRNQIAHSGEYLKHFTYYELFLAGKTIEYTIRLEILNLIGVNISKGNNSLIKEAANNIKTLAYLNNYNQPLS